MTKLAQTLKIKIPAKTFADKMNAKLAEVQAGAKIQGFRPGKAPMDLIRKKYENAGYLGILRYIKYSVIGIDKFTIT